MLEFLSAYSEVFFGLLGVIIGGFITFFTERHYRRKDKFERDRTNYMLSMNELSRIYSDQYVFLKALTSRLPEQQPEVLINNVMPSFSISMIPVRFETEKLIPLVTKRKTYFNDIQLAFDRYNAVLQLFSDYQTKRSTWEKFKKINSLQLNKNSASYIFDHSDPDFIISFLTAENLLRSLISHLHENITDCRKLQTEISQFADKKYKTECTLLKVQKFPSYINNLNELNVGDIPPFKNLKQNN